MKIKGFFGGVCSMWRASTLISIPLSGWTTNQEGGREREQKADHLLVSSFWLFSLSFSPSLSMWGFPTCFCPWHLYVSLFFNCGHRERRGRERETSSFGWTLLQQFCYVLFFGQAGKVDLHHFLSVHEGKNIYIETAEANR